ncbi:MAG: hypothetical protein KAT68_05180 [Bacteroidales bacterium]|nr:hypothetical protein [Bacteroidales bacterium]
MIKIIALLLLLICSCNVQNKKETNNTDKKVRDVTNDNLKNNKDLFFKKILLKKNIHDKYWIYIKDSTDNNEKIKFLKEILEPSFYKNKKDDYWSDWFNAYLTNCHFLDLNNDKKIDLIYNGINGADCEWIKIYISDSGKYIKIFETRGRILYLFRKSGKYHIKVDHSNLPFDFISDYTEYLIDNKLISKNYITYFIETLFPNKLFTKIKFRTKEVCKVRYSPTFINKPCVNYDDEIIICGNIFKEIPKNSFMEAYSKHTDKDGNIWFFSKIKKDEGKWILAWINSDDIMEINE